MRSDTEDLGPEEGREDVGEASEVERGRVEAAAPQAGVPEPVVEPAGLGLGQDLVRLDHFTELLLGSGLVRDVRMELARESRRRA